MSDPIDAERPVFTPSRRVAGDWSPHIATTLDRLAAALAELPPEAWDAPSLCEGWRVRDVVAHLTWRLGEPTGDLVRTGTLATIARRLRPDRAVADLARAGAEASPEELVAELRRIAADKVHGHGRTGITELTEAVVHAFDIFEALGVPLRLSPRSTSAVARGRMRAPFGATARRVRGHALVATDARWRIGTGTPIEGTAGQLVSALFGRRPLPPAAGDAPRHSA